MPPALPLQDPRLIFLKMMHEKELAEVRARRNARVAAKLEQKS